MKFDFSVIRNLRKKRGISAEELAQKAGMTRATIANIERGGGNPTIGTIEALANVFHLAPSELVHLAEKTKLEEGKTTDFKKGNYAGKHIWFPDFEIFFIKAKTGVHKEFDPRFHGNTAEVCVVLSGRLVLTVAGESNELGPGMALRFKALHDHYFDVIEEAEFLMIHHNITA